ncbi:hypothetical protein [Limnohabitans sp. 63ED37-2]|nr:hypothetical protein [Limnohabitans sp. 63ED37-2]
MSIMLAADCVIDNCSAVADKEPRVAKRLMNRNCLTRNWSKRGWFIQAL